MSIKAVLLDMGSTLFRDINAWQLIVDNVSKILYDYGFKLEKEKLGKALREWTDVVNLTERDRVEYSNVLRITCTFKKLGLPLNPRLIWEAFKAYINGVIEGHTLEDDAVDTLNKLKESGYILGVISNAASYETTYTLILKYNLDKYFSVVISSQAVVWKKPSKEIFHLACDLLDIYPSEAVYVGDDPKADIEGAKRAGLKAIQKVIPGRAISPIADAIIYRLSELPTVLEKLH